jgi:hypothetical protein
MAIALVQGRPLKEGQMSVDQNALHKAAEEIFATLGPLNDLGAELSNTVANVYYRFHLMAQNPDGVPGIESDNDMSSNFLNAMGALSKTYVQHNHIGDLIKSLREARAQNASIGELQIAHALDELKYDIKNADKKSLIRRSIERRFCKVDEIAGLYDRMVQLAPEAKQR